MKKYVFNVFYISWYFYLSFLLLMVSIYIMKGYITGGHVILIQREELHQRSIDKIYNIETFKYLLKNKCVSQSLLNSCVDDLKCSNYPVNLRDFV